MNLKFNYKYKNILPGPVIKFPKSVKFLILETNYPLDLFVLPKNLEELHINVLSKKQDITDLQLPDSLEVLGIKGQVNSKVDFSEINYPAGLRKLILGRNFSDEIAYLEFPRHVEIFDENENLYVRDNRPEEGYQSETWQ